MSRARFIALSLVLDALFVNRGHRGFAFLIRFAGQLPPFNFTPYVRLAPLITVLYLFAGWIYGVYEPERTEGVWASSERSRPSSSVRVHARGVFAPVPDHTAFPRLVLPSPSRCSWRSCSPGVFVALRVRPIRGRYSASSWWAPGSWLRSWLPNSQSRPLGVPRHGARGARRGGTRAADRRDPIPAPRHGGRSCRASCASSPPTASSSPRPWRSARSWRSSPWPRRARFDGGHPRALRDLHRDGRLIVADIPLMEITRRTVPGWFGGPTSGWSAPTICCTGGRTPPSYRTKQRATAPPLSPTDGGRHCTRTQRTARWSTRRRSAPNSAMCGSRRQPR